jgi:hypothetical protein
MKKRDPKKPNRAFKDQMLGQVSLIFFYITLLRVPVLQVVQVVPVVQVFPVLQVFLVLPFLQLLQLRQVLPVRQVPVPVPVPQPSGVRPASALLPFCSQPLQMKMSRRKAGIE